MGVVLKKNVEIMHGFIRMRNAAQRMGKDKRWKR